MMRIRLLLAAFVALLLLAAAVPRDVRADEGWTIDRFASAIEIQHDGTLLITESIDVDFGALEKHGVFRDIPIEYTIPGDDQHNRIYGFEVTSVTDATGTPWKYTKSRNRADVELKIGDADRTISGKQSYRIAYRVTGALNAFVDHDELYWNVNGPEWPVPTTSVSAVVSLDGGTALLPPVLDWALRKCREERIHMLEAAGRWMEKGEILQTLAPRSAKAPSPSRPCSSPTSRRTRSSSTLTSRP